MDVGRYRPESTPIKRGVPVSDNNQSELRIKIENIFQSRSSARGSKRQLNVGKSADVDNLKEQLHKKSKELDDIIESYSKLKKQHTKMLGFNI